MNKPKTTRPRLNDDQSRLEERPELQHTRLSRSWHSTRPTTASRLRAKHPAREPRDLTVAIAFLHHRHLTFQHSTHRLRFSIAPTDQDRFDSIFPNFLFFTVHFIKPQHALQHSRGSRVSPTANPSRQRETCILQQTSQRDNLFGVPVLPQYVTTVSFWPRTTQSSSVVCNKVR